MAYNLARNSRVFVTTNVNTATGAVIRTGLTVDNTWELQVLDGFKFAQATNAANIQIKEASSTPIRGQNAFNTALNPADITISTYLRPRLNGTQATAEERILWNALLSATAIEGHTQAGAAVVSKTLGGTPSTATRVSTSVGLVTITGTAMTTNIVLDTVSLSNNFYTIKGVTGTGAVYWNQPVEVKSISSTEIIVQYLTAPPIAAGVVSPAFTTAVKFDKASWVENPTVGGVASYAQLTTAVSNKNSLMPIGFIFVVDGSCYTVDNCAVDQAQIDFGLDAIATAAWTIKGTKLNQLTQANQPVLSVDANPVFTGTGWSGTATGKITTANFITNKLSTVTLQSGLGGLPYDAASTAYSVVITGGSITIANGITYVTPANMGVLNTPIGYFTGTRAVSGNVTAYLKTGTGVVGTGKLLEDILTSSATNTVTKYRMQIEIGGASSGTRVELDMPGAMIGIPSVDIADVVSTSITFTAQATNEDVIASNTFDIENTNDLAIRYYSL